jgi:Flp pilus assembly protein TadG
VRAGRARPDDDRGAITLIVAAMLVVMIGLAALVVDRGLAADTQRQAQNAADASALAAAVAMAAGGPAAATNAVGAAQAYARENFGVTAAEWGACTAPLQAGFTPVNGMSCISQNPATKSVRVTLPSRQVPSVFSGIFGVSSRTVASAATAGFGGPPGSDCLLCVLDTLNGQSGGISVTGGGATAETMNFNNVGGITATGGTINYVNWNNNGRMSTPPVRVGAVVDPYSTVPPPAVSGTAVNGSGACTPGNYIDVSGCTSFASGLYVIVGGNRGTGNEITAPANQVTFFMTCSDTVGSTVTVRPCRNGGEAGGSFGGAGRSSTVLMSGPASGTYRDMALFVDPNNTAPQSWRGNGTLRVTGILYSPNSAGLDDTRGNGRILVNGRMVVGSIQMKGAGRDDHIEVTGTSLQGPPDARPPIAYLTQ